MLESKKAENYIRKINVFLENALKLDNMKNIAEKNILESMRYSLLNPGKRIRPILVLEFCNLCGGNIRDALPLACAIEMIHTYSLIHDDLPCMDNDDLRRGRPSSHIKFGESTAILTGNALLNLAFETVLKDVNVNNLGEQKIIKSLKVLSKASGIKGMIGGQVIDLAFEKENKVDLNIEKIKNMYQKKTGALIMGSATIGCIIAGADSIKIKAAKEYASSFALAFQITDDLLDISSNIKDLGKPINSDIKQNKATLVSLVGVNASKELVDKLINNAVHCLSNFKGDTTFLKELALYIKTRNK